MKRKIAVILAADVVEYSRLVAAHEEETLARLMQCRGLFEEHVGRAGGRIFNTAGDALLVEFSSAVDAVRCAIDVQQAIRSANEELEPQDRMQFRIGITVGDVVEQESDLLGDGVNIASRLQTLAEPGSICVSRSVQEQVYNKIQVAIRFIGERTVKNMSQPLHVYAIGGKGEEAAELIGRFAHGMGISETVIASHDPVAMAEQTGKMLRSIVENLQELLKARAAAKARMRSGNRTMIHLLDNNPLRFSPTAEDALKIMFGPQNKSYLDAPKAITSSFADLKDHQLVMIAAMQRALTELTAQFDPADIEKAVDQSSGVNSYLTSRKARLWDICMARWKARSGRDGNGLLGPFMEHLSYAYDDNRP
jgi:class 3 adenylate cyclase